MGRSLLVVLSLLVVCAVCSQPISSRSAALPQIREEQCNKTTCVGLGQTCDIGGYLPCVGDTYCSSTNHTCIKSLEVGANCTSSQECIYGSCVNERCMAENYQKTVPGGKCTNSSECSVISLLVRSGECVDNRCYGLLIGSKCDYNISSMESGCINSYCKNSTAVCTPYHLSGQSCNSEDKCAFSLTCTDGFCRYPNISGQGGPCIGTDDCADQLFCGSNKTCLSSDLITYAACNESMPCTNGLTCTCNGKADGQRQCWTRVSYGTVSAEIALQQCLEQNNCTTKNYTMDCFDAGLCISQYCAQWSAAHNFNDGYNPITAQCVIDNQNNDLYLAEQSQYCGVSPSADMFPTWAIVLIVIGGLVVLAALAYFVYIKTSKRDQYSAIEHR